MAVCSRTAWTLLRRSTGSRRGRWPASGMWRWIRQAPALWPASAVSTSSASVVGSWGQSALAVSARVGATVIRVPAAGTAGRGAGGAWLLMVDILPAVGRGFDHGLGLGVEGLP